MRDLGGFHAAQAIDGPAEPHGRSVRVSALIHHTGACRRRFSIWGVNRFRRNAEKTDDEASLLCSPDVPLLTAVAVQAAVLPLKHGVGLHEWLNWSPLAPDGSYRWPPYRSEAEWLGGDRPLADWPPGDQFKRISRHGLRLHPPQR